MEKHKIQHSLIKVRQISSSASLTMSLKYLDMMEFLFVSQDEVIWDDQLYSYQYPERIRTVEDLLVSLDHSHRQIKRTLVHFSITPSEKPT